MGVHVFISTKVLKIYHIKISKRKKHLGKVQIMPAAVSVCHIPVKSHRCAWFWTLMLSGILPKLALKDH